MDDLLVFHELVRSLTTTVDLKSTLRRILQSMERFIHADFWALLILDPIRQDLFYVSPDGEENPDLADLRVKVGEGLVGWVAQHGETLIIPDVGSDPRMAHAVSTLGFHVKSAIGLPIRGRRGTHGVLEILNPNLEDESEHNIALLHILTDYAAIAIENTEDVAQAHRLTITDEVTGLFNARHLYNVLEQELDRSKRESRSLSLVFLDLDRFKAINDLHGHLVGSELLGMVGKRIRDLCRPTDLCFRYGGDEFVILMPDTTRHEAVHMTGLIHRDLSSSIFEIRKGLQLSIGSSAGIATYPRDGRAVHSMLGAADKRMYAVKSSGRGRIEA